MADETYRKAKYVTDCYLIPAMRSRSITTLTTKQAAEVITDIAKATPTLANKACQYFGGIVAYAIRHGLREDGRLLPLHRSVPRHEKGHVPAATDPKEVAALAKAIDAHETPVTRAALKLAMLESTNGRLRIAASDFHRS